MKKTEHNVEKTGHNQHYGTESEIAFINGLGSWSDLRIPKHLLLKQYIASASTRKKWGNINRHDAIRHATELLAKTGSD